MPRRLSLWPESLHALEAGAVPEPLVRQWVALPGADTAIIPDLDAIQGVLFAVSGGPDPNMGAGASPADPFVGVRIKRRATPSSEAVRKLGSGLSPVNITMFRPAVEGQGLTKV